MGIKDIEELTIDDMKPITLSFKRNEEELELYKWILKCSNYSGYSGFIKNKLGELKKTAESGHEHPRQVLKTEKELIDLDF